MLEELTVENYALIDKLRVEFSAGLNILTGETGAGKSILVGALGLLLGFKADTSQVRTGSDEIRVAGVVNVRNRPEAAEWLTEHAVDPEEHGRVILRRVVRRNGRNAHYIQSAPTTLRDLCEFASLVFDMHGQHEHQSLLGRDRQRRLLDRYGGIEREVEEFHALYRRRESVKDRYEELAASERDRLQQVDFLTFSLREIEDAQLRIGEEEELLREKTLLSNHERLFALLDDVQSATSESQGGCLVQLRRAMAAMEEVTSIDAALAKQKSQVEECYYTVEDVAESVRIYKQNLAYDPRRLEAVSERLSSIRKLEKKYGNSVEDVLVYGTECRQKLESLENWEERKTALTAELDVLERELRDRAAVLSEQRARAAVDLGRKVEGELKQLGMPKAQFRVLVQEVELNAYGRDGVELMIAPNVGEPVRSLRSIVSGGELSRIMLAVKTVLAESDQTSSLIFDEIDAGIGGEIARAVGDRLKKLSATRQVLCVTHLATIAVRADNHIKVEKEEREGRAITRIASVIGEERTGEVARMLAGDREAEVSLIHAEDLLRQYGRQGH